MTNPTGAMRMLITYVICIPLAILVGYLLTDPLDYGTLGFLGLIIGILLSPLFIKWHYPILIFGLNCPAVCFFLKGKPPLWQVATILCLGIVITERILRSEKKNLSVPVMIWPLLFLAAVVIMTGELNGGIHLQAMGGGEGGGRKYLDVLLGIAAFFALASRAIPPERRKLYILIAFLTPLTGMIGELFPFLPSPLNRINLLFPPSMDFAVDSDNPRLTGLTHAVGPIIGIMLVWYGLPGILSLRRPWRALIFVSAIGLTMMGGYRNVFGGTVMMLAVLFLLEGMHRTPLLPALLLAGLVGVTLLVTFSEKLPYSIQRSMSFLPLKWDGGVLADAEGSSEWRYAIWRATWPKVPDHLLLGKGYTITAEDYEMMGGGNFANHSSIDAGENSLALSGDYHSGPLSTLMPFGVWGAIGIVWLMIATLFVTYRNYRYGSIDLHNMNTLTLAGTMVGCFTFFFIFGAFNNDVGSFARIAGFSIALNGGVGRRQPVAAASIRIKPLPAGVPQPA